MKNFLDTTYLTPSIIEGEMARLLGKPVKVGITYGEDAEGVERARMTFLVSMHQVDIAIQPSDLALSLNDFAARVLAPVVALFRRGPPLLR